MSTTPSVPTRPPRGRPKLGWLLAVPAWVWLIVFFVIPVLQVIWFSFGYKPGLYGTHANDILSFDQYAKAFSPVFFATFQNTLWIGAVGTVICLIIALPLAYWMAVKSNPASRGILLALVMIPYWTNFLVRTIGWQVIITPEGVLSQFLQNVGIIADPLELLYTRPAVLLGVVYNYLPLMILPLYVAFDRVEAPLREASSDLGANRWKTLLNVTLPLARPGIIVGVLLVFIPLMGDYITPVVLGGAKGNMVGQMVANQFQTGQNWALGSAMAVLLIVVILVTAAIAGLIVWLVTIPLRRSSRLVLGPEHPELEKADQREKAVTS